MTPLSCAGPVLVGGDVDQVASTLLLLWQSTETSLAHDASDQLAVYDESALVPK